MAQFQPGESGNPNGRPKGSKNKSTLLAEALESLGLPPAVMLVKTWHACLENGDTASAARIVCEVIKLSFTEPTTEIEQQQALPDWLIKIG